MQSLHPNHMGALLRKTPASPEKLSLARVAGLNPDLGKRRRQKTWADPAVDLKVLTLDLGTQLEYGFTYLRITHIRSVHTGQTDPGFIQPLQAQTHTDPCVDLMLGERLGCLRSAEGLGRGGQGLQLTCRMGISPSQRGTLPPGGPWDTGSAAPEKWRCRPGSQQSPARGPHPGLPGASSRPSYRSPPLPLLPSCCSTQPCSPASLFLGRACPPLLACFPVPP